MSDAANDAAHAGDGAGAVSGRGHGSLSKPFAVALGLYGIAAAVVYVTARDGAGGTFVFPLDDAYIHMAVARTLAETGGLGLQGGAFASPSSSLLWPLLLAGARRLGVPFEAAALGFSLLGGALLLFAANRALASLRPVPRAVATVGVGFVTPVVALALLGMEHTLHAALCVALVQAALDEGAMGTASGAAASSTLAPVASRRRAAAVAALAALAAGARYETVFVVVPLLLVLAVRGPAARRTAVAVAVGALTPVLVAALVFASHGAPLLPQAVIMKRARAPFELAAWAARVRAHPHVPALLGLVGLAWAMTREARARAFLVVAGTALLLHATVAQLGWLFRYEAYAVAVAAVAVAQALALWQVGQRSLFRRGVVAAALVVLAVPLFRRGAGSLVAVPRASGDIARQQRVVADFVAAFAPRAVAVNDVGAVAYFGGARVLDAMGLADLRVARAKGLHIEGRLPPETLAALAVADGVDLAVLYEGWFAGALPPAWRVVERWTLAENHVCAFDTVTFFATTRDGEPRLREALARYRQRLPPGVLAAAVPP